MCWSEQWVLHAAEFFNPGLTEAWNAQAHLPHDRFMETVAWWPLGERNREDLVTAASKSVDDGFDSPWHREVESLPRADYDRVPDIVIALMDVLGYEPNVVGARHLLARTYLERIVAGSVHPFAGSRLFMEIEPDPPAEMAGWIRRWADRPEDCERRIVAEARRLLGLDPELT